MKINKGGRPKKSEAQKRNFAIKFSCTESENLFIEKHAKAAGYKQTALFLHDFFIKTINEGKFILLKQSEVNRDYVNELAAVGNNINQLTHMLHFVNINSHEIFKTVQHNLVILSQVIMLASARAQEFKQETATLNNNKNGDDHGDA